jgi:ribonuclease P protein component
VVFNLVGEIMKKEYRVKKSSEIEKIMKTKQSKANSDFVIYKNENHDHNHFRFAISVSKKYGNAVQRNKIKRKIREAVSKMDIDDHFDIFIIVRTKNQNLSFIEIFDSIQSLLKKQKIMR